MQSESHLVLPPVCQSPFPGTEQLHGDQALRDDVICWLKCKCGVTTDQGSHRGGLQQLWQVVSHTMLVVITHAQQCLV